jgi:hypothetical protein
MAIAMAAVTIAPPKAKIDDGLIDVCLIKKVGQTQGGRLHEALPEGEHVR